MWLSKHGITVTIVEMLAQLNLDIHRSNKAMLLELLEANGVRIITSAKVMEIQEGSVRIINPKLEMDMLKCKTVILATGLKSENLLYEKLLEQGRETYGVGDCREPRKIADAVWEANMVALSL